MAHAEDVRVDSRARPAAAGHEWRPAAGVFVFSLFLPWLELCDSVICVERKVF